VTTTVTGPLVVDDTSLVIQGALAGLGIGLAYEDQVAGYIDQGRLIRVLEDWSPSFPGFFIYYPGRRHQSAALSALIRALRVT
jgi:DNA-binding transcriptional LysR family regulator